MERSDCCRVRYEAVFNIELSKEEWEHGSSWRKSESYLFVVRPEKMRTHLVVRKHGDIAQKLEERACTRWNIRYTVAEYA